MYLLTSKKTCYFDPKHLQELGQAEVCSLYLCNTCRDRKGNINDLLCRVIILFLRLSILSPHFPVTFRLSPAMMLVEG